MCVHCYALTAATWGKMWKWDIAVLSTLAHLALKVELKCWAWLSTEGTKLALIPAQKSIAETKSDGDIIHLWQDICASSIPVTWRGVGKHRITAAVSPVCRPPLCQRRSSRTRWGRRPRGTGPCWRRSEDRSFHKLHPQLSPVSYGWLPSLQEDTEEGFMIKEPKERWDIWGIWWSVHTHTGVHWSKLCAQMSI